MIKDPIVIRKTRGNLIIAATLASDPVQLVRQLNAEQIEVHLKNGSKYIEDVTEETFEETILELMGFRKETMYINFHTWDMSQDCLIDFGNLDLPAVQTLVGKSITSLIFEKTPYIHSKFVEFNFDEVNEQITPYYDSSYGSYDVFFSITFWARVDAPPLITDYCYDIRREIASVIMSNCKRHELTQQKYTNHLDAGYNEFSFTFKAQD